MEIIIRCLCSEAVNIPYADTLSTVVASMRPEGHFNKTTICGMSEFYYTVGQYYIYIISVCSVCSVCVSVAVISQHFENDMSSEICNI